LLGSIVRHPPIFSEDFGIFAQAPVHPGDHVADLEARVLDPHGHAVLRPGASERQQVPAWLQHPQAFAPNVNARYIVVPAFTHERKAIWRIGDDTVNAVIG
jgi:hypothetical protein